MDDLVSDFVCEAAEGLAGLQAGLARLAVDRADAAALAAMQRRLHGLKGLCGFLAFTRSETLAHAGETLLAAIAAAPAPVAIAAIAPLGALIERLGELFAAAADADGEPKGDDADLIDWIGRTALALGAPDAGALVADETLSAAFATPPQAAGEDRRARAPWAGLDGLVRALGDRLGKRIEFMVGGDDVRIAPQAAPGLRLALIALVRNACDHGIESPAERRAAAKPARALLRLSVHLVDGGAAIALSDDGRGIDPARVRASCLAAGRLDASAAAALGEAQAQALVFDAGVTTAGAVTALSGRGLGLELVRREIESLGGAVELSSTPGQGACFVMRLPATVLATAAARRRAAA